MLVAVGNVLGDAVGSLNAILGGVDFMCCFGFCFGCFNKGRAGGATVGCFGAVLGAVCLV